MLPPETDHNGVQRLKLTISYVGKKFHGWQRQTTCEGKELRTVQLELEKRASAIVGRPVCIHASGRTDSGVHADAQVAHMDIPTHRASINWLVAFNSQLPDDVAIASVELVPASFHSQFNALSKLYSYSLWLRKDFTPPKIKGFVWATGELDLCAMQEAAHYLTGTHDFESFRNVGVNYTSTIRTVKEIALLPKNEDEPLLAVWQFRADGFLKQMVRNMMGTLVSVGRGKLKPSDVKLILEEKNRKKASVTAPAFGLSLTQVFYP